MTVRRNCPDCSSGSSLQGAQIWGHWLNIRGRRVMLLSFLLVFICLYTAQELYLNEENMALILYHWLKPTIKFQAQLPMDKTQGAHALPLICWLIWASHFTLNFLVCQEGTVILTLFIQRFENCWAISVLWFPPADTISEWQAKSRVLWPVSYFVLDPALPDVIACI